MFVAPTTKFRTQKTKNTNTQQLQWEKTLILTSKQAKQKPATMATVEAGRRTRNELAMKRVR